MEERGPAWCRGNQSCKRVLVAHDGRGNKEGTWRPRHWQHLHATACTFEESVWSRWVGFLTDAARTRKSCTHHEGKPQLQSPCAQPALAKPIVHSERACFTESIPPSTTQKLACFGTGHLPGRCSVASGSACKKHARFVPQTRTIERGSPGAQSRTAALPAQT
jgi:hypothetical protein